jgi:4-carboxymuconolactone decarboxylase
MATDDLEGRLDNGRQMFREVTGMEPPVGSPAFEASMLPHVFGEIWTRPGLSRKERRWISLTCAATSGLLPPVEAHLRGALTSGDITLDELNEWVLQIAQYAGWPTAAMLETTLRKVGRETEAAVRNEASSS